MSSELDDDHRSKEVLAKTIQALGDTLLDLHASDPALALRLTRLTVAVTDEACRTKRFAQALAGALDADQGLTSNSRRTGRRKPGILDPFADYIERGSEGLRERLATLDLEQLKDIVAEHGMDHDRLAMKWKDPERVIDRIVQRVSARATKGDAFRTGSDAHDVPS